MSPRQDELPLSGDLNLIREAFAKNSGSVSKLMGFDAVVLRAIMEGLGPIPDELEAEGRNNLATKVRNRLQLVENIRDRGTTKLHYDTILNQCVVLLVSHFASALHGAFRVGVAGALEQPKRFEALVDSELKLSPRDLHRLGPEAGRWWADLLVMQRGINFQDMKKVDKAFRDYLNVNAPTGKRLNDIVYGQLTRHCIVHTGATFDQLAVDQLEDRVPLEVDLHLRPGDNIQYTPRLVEALANAMTWYLAELLWSLQTALTEAG